MDPLSDRLAALIRAAQADLKVNQKELAGLAGLSEGQLSGLVTGHKPLRRESYERLRSVLPADLLSELSEINDLASSNPDQLLLHARDVAAVADPSSRDLSAHVIGLITQRFKKADRVDWSVTDETGSVPVVIQRSLLGSAFDEARARLKGERVEVRGFVGRNPRGASSVIATSVDGRSKTDQGQASTDSQIASAIYVARLTAHFRGRLTANGYVEVATRLLSSSWPITGLYPLKALYDGFGQPFFIAPSPMPQLVKALIETRYDSLFTVSRSFTQTYRDPTASVEAAIISTASTKGNIEQALRNCHDMVEHLYLAGGTAPTQEKPSKLVIRHETWPPRRSAGVEAPEVHIYEVADKETRRVVGRLLWPQAKVAGEDFQEYVLAEGYSESVSQPSLTCFTINVERLLSLLFAEVDVRRIPAMDGPE